MTKEIIFEKLEQAVKERKYYLKQVLFTADPKLREIMLKFFYELNDQIDSLLDELNLIIKKGEDSK